MVKFSTHSCNKYLWSTYCVPRNNVPASLPRVYIPLGMTSEKKNPHYKKSEWTREIIKKWLLRWNKVENSHWGHGQGKGLWGTIWRRTWRGAWTILGRNDSKSEGLSGRKGRGVFKKQQETSLAGVQQWRRQCHSGRTAGSRLPRPYRPRGENVIVNMAIPSPPATHTLVFKKSLLNITDIKIAYT